MYMYFMVSIYLTEIGILVLAACLFVFIQRFKKKSYTNVKIRTTPIACIGFRGRLGNLMFQYAFLYSVSMSKGLYPVISDNFLPGDVFRINKTTLQVLGENHASCGTVKSYTERWPCSFDDRIIQVPFLTSAKFNGYFQSWKYWIQYENNLREIFRFQDTIARRANKQLNDILSTLDFPCCSKNSTLVGVHIRRGDYTSKAVNKYGQITPNISYYLNAMNYFENLYPTVLFIVASDDLKWSKNGLKNKTNVYISTGNSGPEDMALLSLTNHTIMSVGTFGWWAAWMTRGTTLYYKQVFAPGSRYAKDFNNDPSNYIYPGWIPME